MQGGEPGGQPLIIELRLHLLDGAGSAGALVLPGLDLCLERLDLGFQRPVLILELVDALPQRLVAGEAVGGGQGLTSKLGGGEPGHEERRKRNACEDGHPRRHGAV